MSAGPFMPPRTRRFKIQKRVDLIAHDRSNKPFWIGTIWRTVSQADRQATAENLYLKHRQDAPSREFRIAEEWPFGSPLRPVHRKSDAGSSLRRRVRIEIRGD